MGEKHLSILEIICLEAFKLKYVRLYLLSKKAISGSEESDDGLLPILTG